MTESEFWNYLGSLYPDHENDIDAFGLQELQYNFIKSSLKGKSPDVIKGFHRILGEKLYELFLPKIGELFVMTSYNLIEEKNKSRNISTDGFIDFRAWIVSLGKKHFDVFVHFQSENELINYNMNRDVAWREDLVYLARDIFNEKGIVGGNSKLDYKFNGDYFEFQVNMEWDNLDKKYPVLFEKYQSMF